MADVSTNSVEVLQLVKSSTEHYEEPNSVIRILPDLESLSQAAAAMVVKQSRKAIELHGRFSLVLSGGNTPKRMYELLATKRFRTSIEWDKLHIFWGDERCVSADDSRSNERMARKSLLNHVPIPQKQIHPIRFKRSPLQTARAYNSSLKKFFGNHTPSFDMVLLGLGENGHTASLFPGSPALADDKLWVRAVHSGEEDFERITLTARVINEARLIVFLVGGKEKANIFREVIATEAIGDLLPARLIHPSQGQLIWLIDKKVSGVV